MDALILLTGIVALLYIARIELYRSAWKNLKDVSVKPGSRLRVTVLVPVRNEAKVIGRLLSDLLAQDYPKELLEILVIDDHSDDDTGKAIINAGLSNVQVIPLKEVHGKKAALTKGVERASGELILTTDADVSVGPQWISAMVACYETERPPFIAGPVLSSEGKGWVHEFQAAEQSLLTALAGASIHLKKPLLCSGANLGFTKKAFNAVGGYAGSEHIPSGDDMFLMIKMHESFPGQMKYVKSSQAMVRIHTEAKAKVMGQRQRWASKIFQIPPGHITAMAILVFAFNFLILLAGILSVINVKFAYALITSLGAKWLVDLRLLRSVNSFFKQKSNPILFFISSAVYPLYAVFTGLTAPFIRYSWKGRRS